MEGTQLLQLSKERWEREGATWIRTEIEQAVDEKTQEESMRETSPLMDWLKAQIKLMAGHRSRHYCSYRKMCLFHMLPINSNLSYRGAALSDIKQRISMKQPVPRSANTAFTSTAGPFPCVCNWIPCSVTKISEGPVHWRNAGQDGVCLGT